MPRYAEGTTVSIEKTQSEIVALLKRYKASSHGFLVEGQKATVMFQFDECRIRFMLFVPPAHDQRFARNKRGNISPSKRQALAEQEGRRLWRSLLLVIKAKLESVDAGIETIEEAFLAQVVLPGGATMAEYHRDVMRPAIAAGKLPAIADAAS